MCRSTQNIRGYSSVCKPCHNAHARARYTYQGAREYNLKRNYGITQADYDEILEAQGGTCAICNDPPVPRAHGRKRTVTAVFHTDHSHASKKVRALLCVRCNTVLGHLRDRPEVLTLMRAYLIKHGELPNIT